MTIGSHDDKPPGSEPVNIYRLVTKTSCADLVVVCVHQEEPRESNLPTSEMHNDVGDGDLIEVTVRCFPN